MTAAFDYNERRKRLTELELSAEGLERFAALSPAARSGQDVTRALAWAAAQIAAQSELLGRMRVALQPFAMAAHSWKGHDNDVIVDGRGFQLQLHHFRAARKCWGTHLS